MLYPNVGDTATSFVVIDHLRPKLSIGLDDIVVPVYPQVGDMLNIRGETDEIWFAYVLSIDERVKTCKVHFYVEDPRVSNKYIREHWKNGNRDNTLEFHYSDRTWTVEWYILAEAIIWCL